MAAARLRVQGDSGYGHCLGLPLLEERLGRVTALRTGICAGEPPAEACGAVRAVTGRRPQSARSWRLQSVGPSMRLWLLKSAEVLLGVRTRMSCHLSAWPRRCMRRVRSIEMSWPCSGNPKATASGSAVPLNGNVGAGFAWSVDLSAPAAARRRHRSIDR